MTLDKSEYTPMIQQFLDVKEKYPQTILLYRMGDFYETFFEDAQIASKELEITLTSRDAGKGKKIDMAGVPHHALEAYLPKLIQRGHKVAICEQMEAPKPGKLVRREVVRVITPGTLLEGTLLNEKQNNYLGAVFGTPKGYGLAYVDISTGEFKATQVSGPNSADLIARELAGLELAELLLPSADAWAEVAVQETEWASLVPESTAVTWESELIFHTQSARERLLQHFNVLSLEGFGCHDAPLAIAAAGAILHYLGQTQMRAIKQVQELKTYHLSEYMLLDRSTRRNLELIKTYREQSFEGSLLWVLDKTETPMGGRLLRDWLNHPLIQETAINERLDAVSEFVSAENLRFDLREALDRIRDVERLSAKVATLSANPRDLRSLADSLLRLPAISALIEDIKSPLFTALRQLSPEVMSQAQRLNRCLTANPPMALKEGQIFVEGTHPELDELRGLLKGGKDWIHELEMSERERTGIKSLKVGYSKTFGYFLEVTHANKDMVPDDYHRKQTLTNAERYITPALKEKEAAILNADDQIKQLEYDLFVALRQELSAFVPQLQSLAQALAALDVVSSLAEVAVRNRYVRPQMSTDPVLNIQGGRHPVIEQMLPLGEYVPNDTHLHPREQSLVILTGPNMSGKSSYMRQMGLIVLMAQMGSFVPADGAQIGICDRVFTRVGAVDDIATGQSTFMVEMMETSHILHHATSQSLILLDEIGRGTSTFDGVSIAWAVSEYLAKETRGRSIFATHYHELNRLSETLPNVQNYQVSVQENQGSIQFLHKVVPGGANRSYGIEVARLAGLPPVVLERAKGLLNNIEKRSRIQSGLLKRKRKAEPEVASVQLSLFD